MVLTSGELAADLLGNAAASYAARCKTGHRYQARLEYLLFWRAIIVLDSAAILIKPAFDLAAEARRFFQQRQADVFGRNHNFHPERSLLHGLKASHLSAATVRRITSQISEAQWNVRLLGSRDSEVAGAVQMAVGLLLLCAAYLASPGLAALTLAAVLGLSALKLKERTKGQ